MIDSAEKMLSPPAVAARLGVKPATVRGWIVSGELRAAKLAAVGCTRPRYRISPVDLEIFSQPSRGWAGAQGGEATAAA